MKFVFSPDVILCGWLGSKHQRTNSVSQELLALSMVFIQMTEHPLQKHSQHLNTKTVCCCCFLGDICPVCVYVQTCPRSRPSACRPPWRWTSTPMSSTSTLRDARTATPCAAICPPSKLGSWSVCRSVIIWPGRGCKCCCVAVVACLCVCFGGGFWCVCQCLCVCVFISLDESLFG